MMSEERAVYIVGDVHGHFGALLEYVDRFDLNDCYLICVGDLGIGFQYGTDGELAGILNLDKEFKKKNIIFMSIRGNHDDPWFWGIGRNGWTVDHPNFKLLHDYTTMDINGEKFLFVGGGISIDRTVRRLGQTYWPDEVFILDESKIVECDVLITHSGPNWIGPIDKADISGWCKRDDTLWDECLAERVAHNTLYKLAKPKRAYLGHFHRWEAVEFNGCYTTILDELQIYQHRPYGKEEETQV